MVLHKTAALYRSNRSNLLYYSTNEFSTFLLFSFFKQIITSKLSFEVKTNWILLLISNKSRILANTDDNSLRYRKSWLKKLCRKQMIQWTSTSVRYNKTDALIVIILNGSIKFDTFLILRLIAVKCKHSIILNRQCHWFNDLWWVHNASSIHTSLYRMMNGFKWWWRCWLIAYFRIGTGVIISHPLKYNRFHL